MISTINSTSDFFTDSDSKKNRKKSFSKTTKKFSSDDDLSSIVMAESFDLEGALSDISISSISSSETDTEEDGYSDGYSDINSEPNSDSDAGPISYMNTTDTESESENYSDVSDEEIRYDSGSEDMDGDDSINIKASDDLDKRLLENKTYPSPSQEDFQHAIYVKRDFSLHAYPYREKLTKYEDIKNYRESICPGPGKPFRLNEHQSLLSNFINPNTPYRGVLVFHGTGSGKTCAAVAVAEKFKPMVEKYGTKIYVLVPGSLTKFNFLKEIIQCTGETYLKIFEDKTIVISEEDKNKIRKQAINAINQYYRIMTYRSFYKKVLGEKIRDKVVTQKNVIKSTARKTETGEYERETSIDRIHNLDNTILIMDEAHTSTAKEYGNAIRKIIDASKQLKILLLTATPMKNLADDIVELLNYIRPQNSQIVRDKIFTSARGNTMEFRPGGKEYLRKMCRGYISYLRGADPLTYAERIDVGEIPPGLDFTKVTRSFMRDFQLKAYTKIRETTTDSLDRRSEAVANFVLPGIVKGKNELEGFSGIDGIAHIRQQVKSMGDVLNKKIASSILAKYEISDPSTLLYLTEGGKVLTGDIFSDKYLKYFSIKFSKALNNINGCVFGQKNAGLVFVYSNLVRCGIELFREVMLRNGYLEYQENRINYIIEPNTRCYYCEHPYHKHKINAAGIHTELFTQDAKQIPHHKFHPATFMLVTGGTEDKTEQLSEDAARILTNVFSHIDNKEGKNLKVVLGSKIMNEGFTLRNIKEIHILDVHFNLAKVDQAIGRGIRWCVHKDITNEDNPFPKVQVYKYVVSIKGDMSSEEELYMKAEQKYKLIKETERLLEEEAIDCPLNYNGNIFPEELEKYGNCGTKDNPCPAICGYMPCQFKCADKLLNAKYYDPERNIYKKVEKGDLDYSTYDNSLADEEINYSKEKIKQMYRFDHIYTLDDIMKYIRKTYPKDKIEMFDDYYVYQALDHMLPVNNNDFNNFRDTLIDKFNRPGYLIYRNRYYIFTPFDENENLPLYYRKNFTSRIYNKVSLDDYVKHILGVASGDKEGDGEIGYLVDIKSYHFDSVRDYYDQRNEFKWVGIVDMKKNFKSTDDIDEFKIREEMPKARKKKRESGIPTWLGAVCAIAKDKQTLDKILSLLKINTSSKKKRDESCKMIYERMFDLEKYSTTESGNKMTYLIVPSNHPSIPFPLNLEDRVKEIINNIQKETRTAANCKINVIPIKGGKYPDLKYVQYKIEFPKEMDKFKDVLVASGAQKSGDKWIIHVL